jgi:hypothetical protein
VHRGQQLSGVLAAGAGGALTTRLVDIAELADAAVALPAVGDHPRSRFDVRGDERMQRRGRGVGDDLHPAPPEPAAPQLVDAFGIRLDIAAQMLIIAGENDERVGSEAAFTSHPLPPTDQIPY